MTDDEFISVFDLPPKEAISKLIKKYNLKPSWSWRDYLNESQQEVFMVAKAMKADILQDIKDALDKAIKEGQSVKDFRSNLEPLLREHGWWGKNYMRDPVTGEVKEVLLGSAHRLKVIFDTNINQAYNGARLEQQLNSMKHMDKSYFVYRSIITAGTTPLCRFLNGKAVLAEDPIWDKIYPMNHFGCRSRVLLVNESEAKRYDVWRGSDLLKTLEAKGLHPEEGFGRMPLGVYVPFKKDYDKDIWQQYKDS